MEPVTPSAEHERKWSEYLHSLADVRIEDLRDRYGEEEFQRRMEKYERLTGETFTDMAADGEAGPHEWQLCPVPTRATSERLTTRRRRSADCWLRSGFGGAPAANLSPRGDVRRGWGRQTPFRSKESAYGHGRRRCVGGFTGGGWWGEKAR